MSKKEEFLGAMALVLISAWSAAITAVILALVNHFWRLNAYTILWINLTLSRWWDILFMVIYVNMFLVLSSFLIIEKDLKEQDEGASGMIIVSLFFLGLIAFIVTLLVGFGYGAHVGFMVGLLVMLLVGFMVKGKFGLPFGFLFGLGFGVAFGLGNGLQLGLVIILTLALKAIFINHGLR